MKRLLSLLFLLAAMSVSARDRETASPSSPLQVDFDEVSVQTVKPGSVTEGLNITELAPTKSDLKAKKNDFGAALRNDAQTVGEGL